MLDNQTAAVGLLMLVLLLSAFAAMARYNVPQALAMPLVACAFLGLQGYQAEGVLRRAFSHFADIAVLFTAVAVPAHMIDRSRAFQRLAAAFGRRVGILMLCHPRAATPILVGALLSSTYILAALLHNVTSILIVTPIIIRLCVRYELPSRWILSAALIASNLGGFSTKWGDTPNIVESNIFGLVTGDFVREVVPANLLVLLILAAVSIRLTKRTVIGQKAAPAMAKPGFAHLVEVADRASAYGREAADIAVDRWVLLVGLSTLTGFIIFQAIWPHLQIVIGALTILIAVLFDRHGDRLSSLKSLGYDVYVVLASIFVLAGCAENSWIGTYLQQVVKEAEAAPWAIVLTGYLGTTFTEAASWATAAASRIYPLDASHTAAWALGGGICAGSSSIVTAASAGIILCEESRRLKEPDHIVTFRNYLPFGLPFSIFMLIFYTLYFSAVRY